MVRGDANYSHLLCGLAIVIAAAAQPVTIQFETLSPAARAMLKEAGVGAADFDRYIARVERETLVRELEGERDHLIFYILQSGEFTKSARIEPAVSAKELVESGGIPRAVE